MKQYKNRVSMLFGKVEQKHIQLILVILTLSMLVLGAGAPGTMGGH